MSFLNWPAQLAVHRKEKQHFHFQLISQQDTPSFRLLFNYFEVSTLYDQQILSISSLLPTQ